jgi:type IV secretion system protein TrbI
MTEPLASPELATSTPPRVTDGRRMPLGVVPRHLQQWAMIGIAVVMVGIMAVSGPTPRPRPAATALPGLAATDPNQQRIEDYQRRIQEQAQRLVAEQAQLQVTKEAIAADAADAARPTAAGSPRAAAEDRPVTHSAPTERAGRDDRSLFADNVAFSRGATTTRPSPPLDVDAETVAPSRPPMPSAAPPPWAMEHPSTEVPPPPVTSTATPQPPTARPTPVAATSTPTEPRYRLFEGSLIETVLTNRLDGTFSGPVNCLVSVPVYASDQQHLLIPAGARVLGEARAVNTFGQSRLAVVFHRVLLPNGTHVDLDGFHGLNQVGDLGLRDQVDRHYAQIFGVSLAIGAIAGLAQAQSAVGVEATGLDVYRQGAASNVSQSSARILDRFLNLLPTVTIREGHRIKAVLANDLELPAYRVALPLPGGRP